MVYELREGEQPETEKQGSFERRSSIFFIAIFGWLNATRDEVGNGHAIRCLAFRCVVVVAIQLPISR